MASDPRDAGTSEGERRLKRYWKYGAGSLKIRWGTDGDFTRCVNELSRHVTSENMVKGLCANMHHEVLGYWPGDTGKPGNPPEGGRRG